MQVKAKKTGRFSNRFIDEGEIFEVPDNIFDQYKDALLTWVEPVENK